MWDKKLCIIGLGCLLQVLNASSDENDFWDIWSKRRNDAPLREDISSERGEGEDYSEKSEVTISSDGLSDEPENDKESTDREEIYDGEENPKKDNVLIIKAKEKLKFWQSEINEINSRIDLMSRYECSEDLKELNKKKVAAERAACFWENLIDFLEKDDEYAKRVLKNFIGMGNYDPIIKLYLEFYNKTLE